MARSTDLTGKRFGKLVVIERTKIIEDRYCTWRCRCDCGSEITVNTKRLNRGTITHCGCDGVIDKLRGHAPLDLTGRQFGRLTVLSRASNLKNGRTAWKCQCECGNQCAVATTSLNAGHRRSCGCLQKEVRRNQTVDLTGTVFGRLTALNPTEYRDKKGSVVWRCRCECGTEINATEDGLVRGHYKSCGCYRQEIRESISERLTFVDNTCIEWLAFRKSRSDNTSGFRGVSKNSRNKWRVMIGLQRKRYYIGTFSSFEDAVKARLLAEEALHDGFLETYKEWVKKSEADREWAVRNPFYFRISQQNGEFLISTPLGNKRVLI